MKQTMIEDLRRWLAQIGAENALEGLAGLCPQGAVFVVDAERRVLFWSKGAEQLLGFTPDEVLGEHCLKSNRCRQCLEGCGIAEHGAVQGQPLSLYRADGAVVNVRKYAHGFRTADGGFAGGIELLVPETSAPKPAPRAGAAREELVSFHGLLSRNAMMHQVVQIIRNVAQTDAPVLLRGESGTGKELAARALHQESRRRKRPFLAVNCAALTPTLLESELFGHVKGAFTGAVRDRPGLFRQADGGTLFLDEVAELSLDLQAKLLRVLQERSFMPVGSERPVSVDVRIVAATHHSLREAVRQGRFRSDLMYRLRVVPVFLPPLRERPEDLDLLLWRFIQDHNAAGRRRIESIEPQALHALTAHRWPGNVRELQNVIEYAFAVGQGTALHLADLPPEFREGHAASGGHAPGGAAGPQEAPSDEAQRIRQALRASGGSIGEAARRLGMSRATFWRKRRRLGID